MKTTKKDLLDLASDVRTAAYIEFYLGHDDRAPDGTRLTQKGKAMIEAALRFQAGHDKSLQLKKPD